MVWRPVVVSNAVLSRFTCIEIAAPCLLQYPFRAATVSGQPVQLRGVAFHGLQWFGTFYRDGRAVDAAANAWGANVVRVAIYLHEGGYLEQDAAGRADMESIVDTIVRRCAQAGIYVILDWHVHHPGDPLLFIDEACSGRLVPQSPTAGRHRSRSSGSESRRLPRIRRG